MGAEFLLEQVDGERVVRDGRPTRCDLREVTAALAALGPVVAAAL